MKRTYIIGIVWTAIIVGVISFGATIFFLDNESNNKETNDLYNELSSGVQESAYITNESSIRTNNFASLNENKTLDNISTDESEEKQKNIVKNNANKNSNSKNSTNIIIDEEDINNIVLENNFDDKVNDDVSTIENDDLGVTENDIEETIESISSNTNSFVRPVKGEVLKLLSTDELVYSKTLQEWNIHNGTDYKAKLGDEVYAIRSGKIKEINFSYVYGDYITIEHDNGYESLYSNVTVLDALTVGKTLNQGELIGYVAESSGFEAADETHLHFELKRDGKYVSI